MNTSLILPVEHPAVADPATHWHTWCPWPGSCVCVCVSVSMSLARELPVCVSVSVWRDGPGRGAAAVWCPWDGPSRTL